MGVTERFPYVSPKVVRSTGQPLSHAGRFTRRGRLVQRAPRWCLFCGSVRQFEPARKAEEGEIAAAAALIPEPRMTARADPDHGDPAICKNCIHPSNASLGDQFQIFAVQGSGIETWAGIVAGGEPYLILPPAGVTEALRIVRSAVDRQAFPPLEHKRPVRKTSHARGPPEMARGSKPPRLAGYHASGQSLADACQDSRV
jgi:hypothetical protein